MTSHANSPHHDCGSCPEQLQPSAINPGQHAASLIEATFAPREAREGPSSRERLRTIAERNRLADTLGYTIGYLAGIASVNVERVAHKIKNHITR